MNKQVLITIGVIVGLLAIWLLIVLVYPASEEEVTEPTVEPTVEETTPAAVRTGGTQQSVVATVEIVDDLAGTTASSDSVDASVTIE